MLHNMNNLRKKATPETSGKQGNSAAQSCAGEAPTTEGRTSAAQIDQRLASTGNAADLDRSQARPNRGRQVAGLKMAVPQAAAQQAGTKGRACPHGPGDGRRRTPTLHSGHGTAIAKISAVNGRWRISAPCVRRSMRYVVTARARTCTRKRDPDVSSVSGIPSDPSKLGRPPSTPRNWVLPDLYRGEGMQGVGPQAKKENRPTCAPLDVIYIHPHLKNTMYHAFPVHILSVVKEKLPQNGAPNTGRAYGARRPHGPNG